ncbi:MAG TPA: hypothetical protein VIF57_12525 [Polyangia bacterium]|jgi:hypothetical protein
MRKTIARMLLVAGLATGLGYSATARADHLMTKIPGSAGKAADATQQACMYYTGAGISNAFCESTAVTMVIPGPLEMSVNQVALQMTVWGSNPGGVQCRGILVDGKTGALTSQTALASSTMTNHYETMFLGWLPTTVNSVVRFECTMQPGTSVLSASWFLG